MKEWPFDRLRVNRDSKFCNKTGDWEAPAPDEGEEVLFREKGVILKAKSVK